MNIRTLIVNTETAFSTIQALGSETRWKIIALLNSKKLSVNQIAQELELPQSTVSTNISILEKNGLISVELVSGKRGSQKLCSAAYDEIVLEMPSIRKQTQDNIIEIIMPIGLYTDFSVYPPCGLCTKDEIIGYLDVMESFYNPKRAVAGLLWLERGYIEYIFPNNIPPGTELEKLELNMELSSEIPGTNKDWPSDITVWINKTEVGTWTSPGDFGDVRGKYTPGWWKLAGSQYGHLKQWSVTEQGTTIDGVQVSDTNLQVLDLKKYSSIIVRIGIKENADNIGGLNIFGKGFGNYDQDIVMKLHLKDSR